LKESIIVKSMVSLLFDIGVIIVFATLLSYFAKLLKQPLIIGYVIAGVIIGPMALGLITSPAEIATLAELGVAFLLFTVGLEIDISKFKAVGKATIIGGLLQVGITFLVGITLSQVIGFSPVVSIYAGLLVAFSSTMIVTKILIDKNEIRSLHGRIMIGILILQDVAVIVALPLLTHIDGVFTAELVGDVLIKGLGLFAIAVVLNKFIFPKLLNFAAGMREILFLTAISIVFVFIGFSSLLGFSIVIGAFIAGIALGNFPYNLEIVGETRALMDFFAIIFFTSLGMSLSFVAIYSLWVPFILLLLMILVIKPIILGIMYLLLGFGSRTSSTIGIGLAQASEFSFIIAAQGLAFGHLSNQMYSLFVSVVVISMVITPYFMRGKERFGLMLSKVGDTLLKDHHHRQIRKIEKRQRGLANHTVIFGCDVTGGRVVNYLLKMGRPFVAVDHDPVLIRKMKARNINCVYGNADNEELVKRLGIRKARSVVITIPNDEVAAFVIGKAKKLNKGVKVLTIAQNDSDAEKLKKAGADVVILPEHISGDRLVKELSKR